MALNESYDDAQLITNVSNNSSGNVEQSSSDARAIILAKGAPKPVEQSDLRSKLSRPIREQVSPPRRPSHEFRQIVRKPQVLDIFLDFQVMNHLASMKLRAWGARSKH